jgi:hypothetical protein
MPFPATEEAAVLMVLVVPHSRHSGSRARHDCPVSIATKRAIMHRRWLWSPGSPLRGAPEHRVSKRLA